LFKRLNDILSGYTILIYFAISLILKSSVISQPLFISRSNSDIPEQYNKLFVNEYRKLISLNGQWNINSQQYGSRNITVPFCYKFKGKVNASRSFDVNTENPSGWNYILYCDGINYLAEIKINGKFIIKHEGGFIQFSAIIPEGTIKQTDNKIEINIDNGLDPSKTIPLANTANYPKNYGGIYRDIYIIAVPKIFIKSINIFSEIDINYNADIKNTVTITATEADNLITAGRKFKLTTEFYDTSGTLKSSSDAAVFSVMSNSSSNQTNILTLNSPIYWSPENPVLYKVKITLTDEKDEVIDKIETEYGIFNLTRKQGLLMLNDSELKLKGINYIEEFGSGSICGTYEETEQDIKQIKSLGCNIIKVYGRQASPYLVSVCNKLGMFIMEEIPVYTVPSNILETEIFLQTAENQLTETINNHKNNPSIFAYGLGNDFDVSSEEGENYVKRLTETARKLDNKLIYYSSRIYSEDRCREYADMTGINFYDNDLNLLKDLIQQSKLKKEKIFISNFGKIIDPQNNSGYSNPNSVESQSKYIIDVLKAVKNSSLTGSFFHSYTDWNSDNPNLKHPDLSNQYMRTSGLYTLYREQRPPAIIFRKMNLEEDIPNLNIGSYTNQPPLFFVFTGLILFILFIYLTNSIRRFRENVWRSLFRPFIFFTDVREQNLIPKLHNILLAVMISVGIGLFFANLIYFWKDSQLFDLFLTNYISIPELKLYADSIIINPIRLTAALSLITFIKIFFIAVIIWLFSLTVKYRVLFNNIYTVAVWGMMPSILLIIIGTFYIRILNSNTDYVIIGLILAGLIFLLSFYRILKGTHIIFDSFFVKVYTYGIITAIIITSGYLFYLNASKNTVDYFFLILKFLKF
jgi:hypothetical protein